MLVNVRTTTIAVHALIFIARAVQHVIPASRLALNGLKLAFA